MSSKYAAARMNKALLLDILHLIQKGKLPPKEYSEKVNYLKRYGHVNRTDHGLVLTQKGRHTINEAAIWNLTISTPKKWNYKWHFVMFDIPKDKRKRRDIFRLRLKELGLKHYQNSVWVYPYPLKDTVKTIADFYFLSKCVSFIVAEEVSGDKTLRKHFNLPL